MNRHQPGGVGDGAATAQLGDLQRPRPKVEVVGVGVEVVGPGAGAVWEALPIGDRRAVLDALVMVTILPTGRRFESFDPDSVRIEWR